MGEADDLKIAVKSTKKLCIVMIDNVGSELQVINNSEKAITLKVDVLVALTLNQDQKEASSIAVKKGDAIFVGQYIFTTLKQLQFCLRVDMIFQRFSSSSVLILLLIMIRDGDEAAAQEDEMVGNEPEVEKKMEPEPEFEK
ncbi:hypothetical protein Bca52824_079561 [Brassica carinata]|uniref:Uncharacterized protein n=1 Tax=Brassica carinata TaxID=52824 RepID=A0A8X7TZG1_BRACI|nr:hypothetical protein Bca52824_079561 [Brassica carinata]